MSAAALKRLANLLPAERLLEQPQQLAAYESDGLTAFRATPLAVAVVESAEEVIQLVRFCRDEKIPFVARGSGTSLSGGSLPIAGGIVIALNRLNRILRLLGLPKLGWLRVYPKAAARGPAGRTSPMRQLTSVCVTVVFPGWQHRSTNVLSESEATPYKQDQYRPCS